MARCRWSLIPAKPRPSLEARRERPVRARDFEDRGEDRPDRVVDVLRVRVRDLVERDFVGRDLLELFSRRSLFTVRAATSSARPP
jgi:hypothetical protein